MPSASSNQTIGEPFTELIAVDSTNNYAMAQVKAGTAQHGAAWFAHHQTAGKGQRNKQWTDEPSQNIIISVVLDTSALLVSQQFALSAAMAVATYHFFKQHAGFEASIKWPNDIYWRDRKAAGMLIENSIRGNNWQWAVVGIGINVNQTTFGPALKNPVSLKQITGKSYDIIQLAKQLCSRIDYQYNHLLQQGLPAMLEEYNSVLYKRHQQVLFKKAAGYINCSIEQVNANGQLEVSGCNQPYFEFGEVEWIHQT